MLSGKESDCNARDVSSILGSGRSTGEGNGNPLQYSCLEKSHGQGNLVGYSPWGHKESDTTERLHLCLLSQWCKSNHLLLCLPLLFLPSVFPSIRVFSSKWALWVRWPKYWSFSFSTSPSNEYSELISFRINWLDLLAVQGTLKSLLQHHSWKASVLQCLSFFMVQPSHPYMTTGKTIVLTIWTFVSKSTH